MTHWRKTANYFIRAPTRVIEKNKNPFDAKFRRNKFFELLPLVFLIACKMRSFFLVNESRKF